MKNIHLIERFMEENGLKYDVPFTVDFKLKNRIESEDFKICLSEDCGKSTVVLKKIISHEDVECSKDALLAIIFNDIINIRKKPWKPQYDDIYWYASIDGYVYSSTWTNHNNDLHRYILGNCFKTKEGAEKYRRDVFKMLDGEPLVKWDD